MKVAQTTFDTIDEYSSGFPQDTQAILEVEYSIGLVTGDGVKGYSSAD